jgi:hypothetical protein
MADGIIFRPPAPTLSIIGWENDATVFGGVALSLPVPSVSTGDQAGSTLSLPLPSITCQGLVGNIDALETALSISPILSVAGSPGVGGSVTMTLPSLRLVSNDPDAIGISLPAPRLVIQAQTGFVGTVTFRAPAPSIATIGNAPFIATSALSISPRISIQGAVGSGADVALTLRRLALAASGYTGTVGRVNVTLPIVDLSAAGYEAQIGTANLSIPMLVLQATGYETLVAPGANASTVVMHTETQAVTRYTNYQFNSFARFNGVYLGAKDDGIFALTGASDNGVLIQAAARVGITDFGTSHLKRVDRVYVGYKTDGDMILRVTTEDKSVRDYRMRSLGLAGDHTNIVKFGRGLEARYWQFELRNENGADFELDAMELKPFVLKRRLWSKP